MSFPEIDCPVANDVLHNVVPGTGNTGVICAHGSAFRLIPPDKKSRAVCVWAKIFETFDGTLQSNQKHPDDAKRIEVDSEGVWLDASIPGALYGPADAPGANILVVWAQTPGTGMEPFDTKRFQGVIATAVSCCQGSGGPPSPPALKEGGSVALATAPLLWTLLTTGFESVQGIFNGSWQLALRPAPGGECVWDNAGDGARHPLVELRCESPVATTWRLTFRHGSETVAEYTRPAAEWNTLAPNTLHRSGNGDGARSTPASLTVTPG